MEIYTVALKKYIGILCEKCIIQWSKIPSWTTPKPSNHIYFNLTLIVKYVPGKTVEKAWRSGGEGDNTRGWEGRFDFLSQPLSLSHTHTQSACQYFAGLLQSLTTELCTVYTIILALVQWNATWPWCSEIIPVHLVTCSTRHYLFIFPCFSTMFQLVSRYF